MRADQLISDLHKKRDEFQEAAKKQQMQARQPGCAPKANWKARGMASRRSEKICRNFRQADTATTVFQNAAAAQLKAWREAAEKIHSAAATLAVDRRSDIDAALTRMKADASKAEANLQEFNRAGTESWAA